MNNEQVITLEQAANIGELLEKYYKPDRYTGRGEEYAKTLLASYEKDYARQGYVLISHYDNITGRVIYWPEKPGGNDE